MHPGESLVRLSPVNHFFLQLCGCIVGLCIEVGFQNLSLCLHIIFPPYLRSSPNFHSFISFSIPDATLCLLVLPEYAISESLFWRKCSEALRPLLFYPFGQQGAEVGRHRTERGKCWKYIVTKNGVLQAYAYQIWNSRPILFIVRNGRKQPFCQAVYNAVKYI